MQDLPLTRRMTFSSMSYNIFPVLSYHSQLMWPRARLHTVCKNHSFWNTKRYKIHGNLFENVSNSKRKKLRSVHSSINSFKYFFYQETTVNGGIKRDWLCYEETHVKQRWQVLISASNFEGDYLRSSIPSCMRFYQCLYLKVQISTKWRKINRQISKY